MRIRRRRRRYARPLRWNEADRGLRPRERALESEHRADIGLDGEIARDLLVAEQSESIGLSKAETVMASSPWDRDLLGRPFSAGALRKKSGRDARAPRRDAPMSPRAVFSSNVEENRLLRRPADGCRMYRSASPFLFACASPINVATRSRCSTRASTGHSAFAAASSEKYIRVCKPILMPRATIQKVTCGAIRRPSTKGTRPGLIVSKRYSPVTPSVGWRPQPVKAGSALPRFSSGLL